jgi:hypothetical protein
MWSGDPAAGETFVARLRSLGHPVVDQITTMPYAAALSMFDASMVDGNHYELRSRWVPGLDPVAVDAIISGAAAVTSPYSGLIVTRLHGAAARVRPDATAFAHRTPHQVVEIIAAFAPGEPVDRHRAWAESVAAALDPVALPGAYPNLLGPADDERARASFAGNLPRLQRAKRRYDPDNVFASAIPALLPATSAVAAPQSHSRI